LLAWWRLLDTARCPLYGELFVNMALVLHPVTHKDVPLAAIDSSMLFIMGFDPALVGKALVETRGDAAAALARLLAEKEKADLEGGGTVADELADTQTTADALAQEEEDRILAEAIQMSLASIEQSAEVAAEPRQNQSRRKATHEPSSSISSAANPLWAPPRYVPKGDAREAGPRTLNLVEPVTVRDGGYAWQRATAFLDTGNQHMTLVDTEYARRHALYRPVSGAQRLSGQGSAFGQAERWTTIQGVVPGASTRAPVVTMALKVRDQEMLIEAAVCQMPGHDLLIGKDVLAQLFAAGFRIGAGSM